MEIKLTKSYSWFVPGITNNFLAMPTPWQQLPGKRVTEDRVRSFLGEMCHQGLSTVLGQRAGSSSAQAEG